ncbi:RNA polymerase sigma factor SigM [Micromonospora sp. URMC 103]|uniref:RNA polymerase sigma factor SigM n=1 Tax=Micromonospora sp. URMC 103 TaxID=3423406 RepID=UPI003F1C38A4
MDERDTRTGRLPAGTPGQAAPDDPVSDLALLHAHVAGDRDAFAELFHRHRDRLWAVALRTMGDREEAADALQDALLSAHRAAGRFRGDSAVTTWLHRIVVNACLDRIRRRQAHPTVPLPDGVRTDSGSATGGVEPAAPAHDHDTALVVRDALAALPVEQRAALVLVDLQGYPVAEVARMLGVAEGTVKSRCARGRARLAVLLGHLRPTPADTRPTPTDALPVAGDTRPGAEASRPAVAAGAAVGDVPPVTSGNPRPPEGVGSGPGRSRRDANQEDT